MLRGDNYFPPTAFRFLWLDPPPAAALAAVPSDPRTVPASAHAPATSASVHAPVRAANFSTFTFGFFGKVVDQGSGPPNTVLHALRGRKIKFCRFYGDEKYGFAGFTETRKYNFTGSGPNFGILDILSDQNIKFLATIMIFKSVKN